MSLAAWTRRLGCAGAIVCAGAAFAQQQVGFYGRVLVEWLAPQTNMLRMRLLDDFGYRDQRGKNWSIRRATEVDTSAYSDVYRVLVAEPFATRRRRAELLHQVYSANLVEPWPQVRLMFYETALAAGSSETEAKIMYLAAYATGPRWALPDSSCYQRCHRPGETLVWRPKVEETDLYPVVEAIEFNKISIDDIHHAVAQLTDGLPHPPEMIGKP
jgi:hypothetical protein